MTNALPDISRLSRDERLQLLEILWASFEEHPRELPLTEAQRSELDSRVEAMNRDNELGLPWEEVVSRIRDKKK